MDKRKDLEMEMLEGKKESRDKYIDRIIVLDKVKELNCLPNTTVMTTGQVAEYYNVEIETISRLFRRNREELELDNATHRKHSEIKELVNCEDLAEYNISPNGSVLYPINAIIKVAFMLRDSDVAKEVVKAFTKEFPEDALKYTKMISYKKYEDDMYAYLVATFGAGNIERQVEHKGYLIDFVLFDHIAIEVDEDGHSGYVVLHEEKREQIIKQKYMLFRYDTREGVYFDFISKIVDFMNGYDLSDYVSTLQISKAMNAHNKDIIKHIGKMRGEFLYNGMRISTEGDYLLNNRSLMLLKMTYESNPSSKITRDYIVNKEYKKE